MVIPLDRPNSAVVNIWSGDRRSAIGNSPRHASGTSPPRASFCAGGFEFQSPIGFVRVYPRSEKLRLTEEIARLEFAPVGVLRQRISLQP